MNVRIVFCSPDNNSTDLSEANTLIIGIESRKSNMNDIPAIFMITLSEIVKAIEAFRFCRKNCLRKDKSMVTGMILRVQEIITNRVIW